MIRQADLRTPTRWHRADALLGEALERPTTERKAFVLTACGADKALADAVLSLVEADERSNAFLTGDAGEAAVGDEAVAGRSIGPYKTLRIIGRGGSATVYLAVRDDGVARRLVALKVTRPRDDAPELIERFRRERQILANLEHPNIARMYDGGACADGGLFVAMELVDGLPIDQHCDTHRLSVAERLDLFVDVCAAVQHAHRNLLVHRDIKPANVLVSEAGVAKLLDFGIAKLLAHGPGSGPAAVTRADVRPMTPRYASPEQVAGAPISTASDVYSLGVLLYELLAGRSPYRLVDERVETVERAIRQQTPEPPSRAVLRPEADLAVGSLDRNALAKRLRGDLDTIVAKALAKRPEDRYGSVGELAEDLRRHLAHRPLIARPATRADRARRFVRRHRLASLAAAAVLVLVAGFIVTLRGQVRARERAHASAEAERSVAERERAKAESALDFLVDMFQGADLDSGLGKDVTARELVDRGALRVASGLSGQPLLRATIEDAIGLVYLGLGQTDAAREQLDRAYAVRRKTLGPKDPATLATLHHLASVERLAGRYTEAKELAQRSLALRRIVLGPGHLATAESLVELGAIERLMGNHDEAAAHHRKALEVQVAQLLADDPMLADTQTGLGLVLARSGDLVGAEQALRAALTVYVAAYGDGHPATVQARGNLGYLLNKQGRFAAAEPILRQALSHGERHFEDDHPRLVTITQHLAIARQRQGDIEEAAELLEAVVAKRRSRLGSDHPRVAFALNNLAVLETGRGRLAEAERLHREALAIRRQAQGEDHVEVAWSLINLADVLRAGGEHPQATLHLERALVILASNHGRDHATISHALVGLAKIHADRDNHAAALSHLEGALDIRRRTLGPGHWQVGSVEGKLGDCLLALGRHEEAEPHLRSSLETLRASFGDDHPRVAEARERLVGLYEAAGRLAAVGREAADS